MSVPTISLVWLRTVVKEMQNSIPRKSFRIPRHPEGNINGYSEEIDTGTERKTV